MNNFSLIKTFKENSETFRIYKHKSGLEVIYGSTIDLESVFCATFKTEPDDDRGIPHILEHIALCGSKKYPIDDPFNELIKGSIYSYLNAITFKDKTVYPLSTKNIKEFHKMYKVYLDAVFAPILSEQSFLKEGVRQTSDGYSGVVFNEMSSVYNDVLSMIDYYGYKNLFKGTPYEYDSGGHPDYICKTKYNDVVKYYEDNYKIENATLYFYGKLDDEINSILDYIEYTYLKTYTNNEKENSDVDLFPIMEKEGHENISVYVDYDLDINYRAIYFKMNRVFDNNPFYLDYLSILFDYLLSSDTSVLTAYLKEKYDLIDLSYDFEGDTYYSVLSIILKSENEISDLIYEDIYDFLHEHIKNGFDKEELDSIIHMTNFKYIEEDYGHKAKGLSYFLDIYSVFGYTTKRDYIYMSKNFDFDKVFKNLNENYFEKLLLNVLENNIKTIEMKVFENAEKLQEENFNDIEDNIIGEILPFSDKYIETIPISEISFSNHLNFEKNGEVFFIENENKDITYLTFAFLYEGDLTYIGLFLELMLEVETHKYSKKEIKIKLDKYIGDIDISFEPIKKDEDEYKNYIVFELKVLTKYIDESLNLLEEIINNSNFDDEQFIKTKIDELILSFNEEKVTDNIRLGLIDAYKSFNEKYYLKDIVEGNTFYENLLKWKKNKQFNFSKLNDVMRSMKKVNTYVCSTDYLKIQKPITNFLNKLTFSENSEENKETLDKIYHNIQKINNENDKNKFVVADTDTYTNICVGYLNEKIKYSGVSEVFAQIVKNDYFNKEIRLQGGAYGYDMFFDYSNMYHMFSIDDPLYEKTLDVFKNIDNYIKSNPYSQKDMNKHIIGTFNELENYKNFYDKYYNYVLLDLRGIKTDFIDKVRNEILCTDYTKINKFSSKFDENVNARIYLSIGKKAEK